MSDIIYPVNKIELEKEAAYIKQRLAEACPLFDWRIDLDPFPSLGGFIITGVVIISGQRIFAQGKLSLQEFQQIEHWDKRMLYQFAGALTEKIMAWRPGRENERDT